MGVFTLRSWGLLTSAGFVVAEEARSMLQGVGSRFDFHINKTLCDLRCFFFIYANTMYSLIYNRTREIFDIIIDFPDSMGALNDLKVPMERLPLFAPPPYPALFVLRIAYNA